MRFSPLSPMREAATAEPFNIETLKAAVYEPEGFGAALDCDLLISCVDRPWGRYVLNLIAYAHMIHVIDGGIAVQTNKLGKLAAADWRAHTATVGRPCLQCLGQYDPGLVQAEREGLFDDPDYVEGLPKDHPAKTRENVYAFAVSCGAFQLSFPKIISGRIGGAVQPGSEWRQWRQIVGLLDEKARLSVMPSACALDCNTPHKWKELAADAPRRK